MAADTDRHDAGHRYRTVAQPQAALVDRKTGLAIGEWLARPDYIFFAFIQMTVIPLILSSIIRGIAAAIESSSVFVPV